MEPLYRLVFKGELKPGTDSDAVIAAFAKQFHLRETTAGDVIRSGGRRVLKHDLDRARAERYRSVLEQIGLVIAMEPQDAAPGSGFTVELEPSIDVARITEAPGDAGDYQESGETICPKCGAQAVSPVTGICDACGVVAERYLARQAAEQSGRTGAARDPYAHAEASSRSEGAAVAGGGLQPPRSVSAGRGWGWVAEAWGLFRDSPLTWIGAFLVYALIMIALSFVPLIGPLAATLLGPILTAGFMIGAHVQHGGGRFVLGHVFSGFSDRAGPLALIGVAYLGAAAVTGLLIAAVLVLFAMGAEPVLDAGSMELGLGLDPGELGPMVLISVLVGLLIAVPIAMAMLFAPALVAIDEIGVMEAFRLSFLGCWRNILPFLVYGLVALALIMVGTIPMGLGLLVVFPLLTIAIYLAYRDIYHE